MKYLVLRKGCWKGSIATYGLWARLTSQLGKHPVAMAKIFTKVCGRVIQEAKLEVDIIKHDLHQEELVLL